jgi:hypothetical protein
MDTCIRTKAVSSGNFQAIQIYRNCLSIFCARTSQGTFNFVIKTPVRLLPEGTVCIISGNPGPWLRGI